MSNRLIDFSTIFLLSLVSSASALPSTYPWVTVHQDDIQLIADPYVEETARLNLIRSATRTIDVITYDQRTDARVGFPILKAIREAAERGVHVRFATAWFATLMKDQSRLSAKYLLYPATRGGVEYIVVGGPHLYKRGFKMDDEVHEKILLVDGEKAMITGRGHAEVYLNWIDTAFMIRGSLIDQIKDAFENVWSSLKKEEPLYQSGSAQAKLRKIEKALEQTPAWVFNPEQDQKIEALNRWIEGADLGAGSVVGRGRLLHFDLFRQLRELGRKPRSETFKRRAADLDDPVVDAMVERVAQGRDIEYNTISFLPHPKLKAALYRAVARGAQVQIFTNGKGAYQGVLPLPMPWWAGLPDLDEALEHGLEVFAFMVRPTTPWKYLHRKVAVIDDAVIFGSHNLNLPSSLTNDEMSVEVENPSLATELRGLFKQSLSQNGKKLDGSQIHKERKRTGFWTWLGQRLIGLY